MKPGFEKILELPQHSFFTRKIIRENRPSLTEAWHYHPEIEICYTKRSTGKRFVGNNISEYEEGDLVMLGSNLPHGFTTVEYSEQIVIQLHRSFLGESFFKKPEMRAVNELIEKSKMGLQFKGKTQKQAKKLIKLIYNSNGFDKLIYLFKLLDLLSKSENINTICSKEYSNTLSLDQLGRIKKLFEFIEQNYKREISIQDGAELVNLTESAFYKFIKRHTKKKFTQIINEYRINHASKLLINTELTIAEIAYDCGYNNLSYFNRKFKEILDYSPSNFRIRFS